MCVIVAKDEGCRVPDISTLRKCWDRNPHGAGFMWKEKDGSVSGKKGFMTWEDFESAWKSQGFSKDDGVIIHFRLATSGGISQGNCHPFPVTKKVKELKALSFNANMAVVHNGVFGAGTDSLSDTMLWVKDFFSDDPKITKKLEKSLGFNRVAIMGKGLDCASLLGHGWSQYKECWFSNTHWVPIPMPTMPILSKKLYWYS